MNINCQALKISGIYKIINKVNGKYYVGSSDNITGTSGRWNEHINDLVANRHINSYLQRSWNKYGKNNFEFLIIEEIPKVELLKREQKYLNEAKKDGKQCYNLSYSACGGGMIGLHHSEESKKKISEKLKGRQSPNKGPNPNLKGNKNPKYDHTIYSFKNIKTNEYFVGERYKLREKFNLERTGIDKLVAGIKKSSNGWILNN